jgi:hypothetical protein
MGERIAFSRTLYSVEAVQAAVKSFEHLAKLTLSIDDESIALTMDEPDPDFADILLDELANHALAGTVVRTQTNDGRNGNP